MQPAEKEKLERGFAGAEASLFWEGMKPTENLFAVNARILAGEITFELEARKSLPSIGR